MSEGNLKKSIRMDVSEDFMAGKQVKHPLGPTSPDESADFMKNTGSHEGQHGGQPESGVHGSEEYGKPGADGGEDTTELDEDEGAEAEAGGDD